jgi:PAS domain S-box-containing protein
MTPELHRRAEARLRKQRKDQKLKAGDVKSEVDSRRLLHELQVHQIELEMQNVELQESRDRMEVLLAKYADLYDFAPVGYLSLDEQGRIIEVNLTGAALLGMERSRLINRRLPPFVVSANRPDFLAFLEKVFAGAEKQVCKVTVQREDGTSFWANFHGAAPVSAGGPRKWCRVVVSDITALKESEEARRRLEDLAKVNRELREEIVRRQEVEKSLKKSEQHQSRLLEQARCMQEELRHLSREVLRAQEEERKRISRELHDKIAQTLVGINVHLEALIRGVADKPGNLRQKIARTQRLVQKSMDVVHLFARELRPPVLDDLGLIPALHGLLREFTKRTGVRASLTAFAAIERVDIDKRTILFRVAHEALNNVARHAQASRVEVCIEKLPAGVSMKITDNGKSFDVESVMRSNHGRHLGLIGMRERLEMIDGIFNIESAPGKGTTIQAQIPLPK